MKYFSQSLALSVTAWSRSEKHRRVHIYDLSLTFISPQASFRSPKLDFSVHASTCRLWASGFRAGSVWSCLYRVFVIKHRWGPVANSARAQSARRNVPSVYITHMIHKHNSTNGPSAVSLVGPRWASFNIIQGHEMLCLFSTVLPHLHDVDVLSFPA